MRIRVEEINILNPDNIKKLTVLKDTAAMKLYGEEARSGALVVKIKRNIAPFKADSSSYAINSLEVDSKPLRSFNLPVYIDSLYVNRPEKLDMLMGVKSATICVEPTTGIKFINIITDKSWMNLKNNEPKHKYKKNEVRIILR